MARPIPFAVCNLLGKPKSRSPKGHNTQGLLPADDMVLKTSGPLDGHVVCETQSQGRAASPC
jgi:hypothetical protein